MKGIIKSLPKLFSLTVLFSASFLFAVLLSRLLSVPFKNSYHVIGPLTHEKFNPLTNTVRYFAVIILTSVGFLITANLYLKGKRRLLRLLAFIFIFFLLFSHQTLLYQAKFQNIDMFHDGEQLGPGSAMYLFEKKPFSDIFFLHGYLADPGIAYYAFKLFGYSIGSYYLLKSVAFLLSFTLLAAILYKFIKKDTLYYLGLITLSLIVVPVQLYRDIGVFLYLLLLCFWYKKKNSLKLWQNTALTFIAALSLYVSIERGFYILFVHAFFLLLFSLSANKPLREKIRLLISFFFSSLAGFILALLLLYLAVGAAGVYQFFLMTFKIIPQVKPLFDEYRFPVLSLSSLFPYWFPVLLVSLYLSYLLYRFLIKKEKANRLILPAVFSLLAVFFFRNALGRVSIGHVQYVVHIVFLAGFFLIDQLTDVNRTRIASLLLGLVLTLSSLPFADLSRLFPPDYSLSDVRIYFDLPKLDDDYWLKPKDRQVRDAILNFSTERGKLFVFSDDPPLYYLTKRENPTRFYTAWFAAPDIYQQEVLNDLSSDPPEVIIYPDKTNTGVDSLSNPLKMPEVSSWILKNYRNEEHIGNLYLMVPIIQG